MGDEFCVVYWSRGELIHTHPERFEGAFARSRRMRKAGTDVVGTMHLRHAKRCIAQHGAIDHAR